MNKEIAKQKYKNGEIQICYDVDNIELLREIIERPSFQGIKKYYAKSTGIVGVYFSNEPTEDKTIVNISEITESEEVLTLGNMATVTRTPSHYINKNGTLYKVAQEREWNAYVFDAVKRLDRAEKKGEFFSDIDKAIHVLQLYKQEQGHRFPNQVEPLNK